MNSIFRYTLIVIGLLPSLAMADTANTPRATPVGRLDATQLQAVQQVSRSVLEAKRGQVPNSDQLALRDEVKALSAAIDQALAPQTAAVTLLNNGPGQSPEQASRPSRQDEDHFAPLRSRLSSLRERRRQVEARRPEQAGRGDHVRTEDLVAKVGKLDTEVQAALDAPAAERFTKLRELHARLQPKGLNELMTERRAEAEAREKESGKKPTAATPTISTIVRHR